MLHEPLVVLDFETTGLRPLAGDRITEVGLVRIEGGRIVSRYQSLANCDVHVPHFITSYTGITQQMVDAAPPVARVMREVVDFIGDTPVVAHSASFDERFFQRECRHLHMSVAMEPFLCSMRLARRRASRGCGCRDDRAADAADWLRAGPDAQRDHRDHAAAAPGDAHASGAGANRAGEALRLRRRTQGVCAMASSID
jgi:DNA polymerase III epsilon subunit-like protein